jgi:hypothetical protein
LNVDYPAHWFAKKAACRFRIPGSAAQNQLALREIGIGFINSVHNSEDAAGLPTLLGIAEVDELFCLVSLDFEGFWWAEMCVNKSGFA